MQKFVFLIPFFALLLITPVFALDNANLVGWWKFDEPSGTVAIDSANDNNGTLTTVTVNQTGKLGRAYSWADAANANINFGKTFSSANGISYNIWVKVTSDNIHDTMISTRTASTNQFAVHLRALS